MRRGEIWWADFPGPASRRPALLVSRDAAYSIRQKVTVAEVTRIVRGIESEIGLGQIQGLPARCVANLDNLVTIPKTWLSKRAGALSREKLKALDEAICFSLGVDD